jgi:UPF0716 family protein affecting phage T7 exclusion
LIAIAVLVVFSAAAFPVFLKTGVGGWWSLLLSLVVGGATLGVLMVGLNVVNVVEWFRDKYRVAARPKEHKPSDGPSDGGGFTP